MYNNSNNQKNNIKPRLIPSLEDTSKNYIKFIKPFISDNKKEAEEFEKRIDEFNKTTGVELQKRLLEKNKTFPSWLSEFVIEHNYLSQRNPISIDSSYYTFYDFEFKNQIDGVVKLILYSLFLKNLIKTNKVSQFTSRYQIQQFLLFHICRIPELERDKLLSFDYTDNKYVIVIYNNIFWMVEVSLDYQKILEQISYITSINLSESHSNFIGIFTNLERNKWAVAKEKFCNLSKRNKEFMECIERSMMLISLESNSSYDLAPKELNKLLWYRDGQNRYYDKVIQFIVLKNGTIAMNADNRLIDHCVIIEFSSLIYDLIKKNEIKYLKRDKPNYFENFSYRPIKLNYDLDDELKSSIKSASEEFLNLSNIHTEFFLFNDYGKYILDKKRLNIDSYLQIAILSAYYRVYKKIVPSRQFVCGKNCLYGISEWIRTTTKESANFSIALNENKIPRDLKIRLGQDAFKQHKNNYLEVNNGKSIDSHFLGLLSVLKTDENIPSLFEDYMFVQTSKWMIDVYPIFQEYVKLSANPPPCHEGISITYIIRRDNIQFTGAGYEKCNLFFQTLNEILKEMKDLFIEKEREIRPKF